MNLECPANEIYNFDSSGDRDELEYHRLDEIRVVRGGGRGQRRRKRSIQRQFTLLKNPNEESSSPHSPADLLGEPF
jgi:hypothetical protein